MGHVGLTTAPPQYGTSASKWYIKALEACAPIAKFSKVGVLTSSFSNVCVSNWHIKVLKRRKKGAGKEEGEGGRESHSIRDARNLSHECTDCFFGATGHL